MKANLAVPPVTNVMTIQEEGGHGGGDCCALEHAFMVSTAATVCLWVDPARDTAPTETNVGYGRAMSAGRSPQQFTKQGADPSASSRRPVPFAELLAFHRDMLRQISGLPRAPGSTSG